MRDATGRYACGGAGVGMFLRGHDARKLLAVVGDLADVGDQPLAPAVVREIPRLVSGDMCAANTVTVVGAPSVSLLVHPHDVPVDPDALVQPHIRDDPFIAHLGGELTRGRPGRFASAQQALRTSDLVPMSVWTRTDLYQAAYRPFSLLHQLAGIVDVRDARVRSYAVIRDKRDFTDRERDIFTFLHRELTRLHGQADGRARLRTLAAAAHEVARSDTRAVAAVAADGELIPLNAGAAELLAAPELRNHPQLRRMVTDTGAPPVETVAHVRAGTAELLIQVFPAIDPDLRCLLVLHDDRRNSAAARRYHLTNRERDVLSLVAGGYTAHAVARRLRLSPRSVQKYQERIYAKLGVHDRLSAVLRAQRLGILAGRPGGGTGSRPEDADPA